MTIDTRFDSAVRSIILRLSDAIVYLDIKLSIIWWNPSAAKLLSLKKHNKGMDITGFFSQPEFSEFLREKKDSVQLELKEKKAVNFILLPHENKGYLLVAKDISEMFFLNKVKQDFVANVSHELRTPLTVMHGYLETLTEQEKDHPYHGIYEQMLQQTERMNSVVNDLLLLSRLEGQRVDTSRLVSVDVPLLLGEVIRHGQTLSNNQHTISLSVESDKFLKGDKSELQSAFSNLLFNAIRYTPQGGNVALRWYEEKDQLKLSVKDTGIGIPEKHIPRLTERFYRVDKGRSRDAGGTGLGLAIVKHVLLRHHATLKIYSEEQQGSEFVCCFPSGLVSTVSPSKALLSWTRQEQRIV